MNFVVKELAGLAQVAALPGFEDAGPDTVEAVLDEAAKFASQVLAPINTEGDKVGCTWSDGQVTTPPGFKEDYGQADRQTTSGGTHGRLPQFLPKAD